MALTPYDTLVERIARVTHAANRAYCLSLGDNSQPFWTTVSDELRNSLTAGIRFHLDHPEATPEDSHTHWMAQKISNGWRYGPVKDVAMKRHPCIMAYRDLPPEQRIKDSLFKAIVNVWRNHPTERNEMSEDKNTNSDSYPAFDKRYSILLVEEISQRVAEIDKLKDDNEAAHIVEDALHQDVLRAIAEGRCGNPAACAREALKTLEIEFHR